MRNSSGLPSCNFRRKPEPVTQLNFATYFHMDCMVCGRQLQVNVEYLGQAIACGHCGGRFLATDSAALGDGPCSMVEKADQLLAYYTESRLAR